MNKKLRVGVVGVGHLGKFHAEKYYKNKDCYLQCIADSSSRNGENISKKYNCTFFHDYKSMVDKVDAVSVATPTTLHYEITDFFLENGIHVLVEKPITNSVQLADKLLQKARDKKLILLVGHVERFNPSVQSIINILGNREDNHRVKHIVATRLTQFNLRANDVNVVTDLMIHDIDLTNFFFKSPVGLVQSNHCNVVQQSHDLSTALLSFTNGCSASLYASRIAKDPIRQVVLHGKHELFTLDLNKKTIHQTKFLMDGNLVKPTTEKLYTKEQDALENEISAFINNILTGKIHPCSTSASEGIEALRIAETITNQAVKRKQYDTNG